MLWRFGDRWVNPTFLRWAHIDTFQGEAKGFLYIAEEAGPFVVRGEDVPRLRRELEALSVPPPPDDGPKVLRAHPSLAARPDNYGA